MSNTSRTQHDLVRCETTAVLGNGQDKFEQLLYRAGYYRPSSDCLDLAVLASENHGNWKRRGSLTMRSRVNAKVRELLESHKPEPLPTDLDARLSSLISGAEGAARRSAS